ncbi:Eco57I restriction-modification methylase domain-containing protein [Halobaculum roseum]|uniref:site-specific DNA-methyltransferase (adenine-specific) n=1 Tax=Halobaculum roseum TaxID=2175149 RepID=A0ABD5MSQ7_9EURY|nr:N-6 DNA methylase [Halobaculum roseum]QZY01814.1 Eco57I restriction-modification methylase domain-containing protein [Halobaculum roseum]
MSQATLGSAPYRNSNLFSGYYLDERVDDLDAWDCDEAAGAAFEELQHLWELEGELVASYKEDELLDSWIDEVLDVLGFGSLSETTLPDSEGYNDRLLFESDEKRRDASSRKRDGDRDAMYSLASAVLEAKQWDADFTQRFAETRSYRDASHQIKYYLEHTPERLEWGILTDGRTWRLYGTKDYATETYYEVNLPELLESGDLEQFKYFYAFFRPAAFRETAGTTFLETVWNESETAAQELGEDLQDNVFTALRILGEGFVETNDLAIDPDDEEAREELKEQSLVLLYRLMFVLYAESRHLISPDEPAREAEFNENFSLDELRQEIHEDIDAGDSFDEYSEYSTSMWGRLQDLFGLIDSGEESLGIPPYNGGLFDDDEHAFLANNEVADRYVAEVVYRLGTTTADDGDGYVLADYADLDTRHLGTIYEGLLEHEFRIASEQYAAVSEDGGQVWKPATEVSVADAVETVEAGELYVVNDDGERKATGAYYTPDYVVAYIVEETIDPLVEEIKADIREEEGLEPGDKGYIAPFLEQIRELTVLDPAMGSGHFLTKATGYLTEQVMEVIRQQEIQSYDEQDIRRIIARECIYGVDINGMAVELAKLSMWLETLATDQPLAFLDHHLKDGNSLVGSDITEVLSDDSAQEGGQLTLTQVFAKARRDTLEHVMELMSELLAIDNETLADIKSMEETYDEIRSDPLYGRLFELANVHTAEQFGLDVPEGVYEEMAGAIEDAEEWAEVQGEDWFASAQAMADDEDFFHWELEYPEVFFGTDGEKRDDGGFDAVVGNPPYVRIQELRTSVPEQAEYLSQYRSSTRNFDLYANFTEKGYTLLSSHGYLGYIEPHKFFQNDFGEGLREFLAEREAIEQILSFGHRQVFRNASVYTCVLVLSKSGQQGHKYAEIDPQELATGTTPNYRRIDPELDGDPWVFKSPEVLRVLKKIDEKALSLADATKKIYQGVITSADNTYLVNQIEDRGETTLIENGHGEKAVVESSLVYPFLKGQDVKRYEPLDPPQSVILPYHSGSTGLEFISEDTLESDYPNTHDYLKSHESDLRSRDSGSMDTERWYDFTRAQNMPEFLNQKLVTPEISYGGNFTYDDVGVFHKSKVYGIVAEEGIHEKFLLTILNSKLLWFYLRSTGYVLRGGYFTFKTDYLEPFCLPNVNHAKNTEVPKQDQPETVNAEAQTESDSAFNQLCSLANSQLESQRALKSLNLKIQDHLGSYSDGPKLADVGFTQPPEDAAESILQETTEQKPNLRVGHAEVIRRADTTVEIQLTARYKPDDEDAHETDQWGYTETDPLPALRITDLTETEADLIEAFVPVAVDEAGGFAGFRETATKTNSLVDRLRALTLPAVDDVRDGLESYLETKARAEELEEQIERTDDLIDEIVYELYGLTDEEIEIVEEAVGE